MLQTIIKQHVPQISKFVFSIRRKIFSNIIENIVFVKMFQQHVANYNKATCSANFKTCFFLLNFQFFQISA